MKEIWKSIPNYEEYYMISNFGRIKSILFRNNTFKKSQDKILHPTNNGYGYLIIPLNKNGKRKNHYIHRLVAEIFCENPNNQKYVNHKDFNKQNNNANNLEWCSQKENISYSKEHMEHPNRCGTKSATNLKYIYYKKELFRVVFKRFNIDKCFNSIEKAIEFRNKFIKEHKDYYGQKWL